MVQPIKRDSWQAYSLRAPTARHLWHLSLYHVSRNMSLDFTIHKILTIWSKRQFSVNNIPPLRAIILYYL